jgi:hypothetical protein
MSSQHEEFWLSVPEKALHPIRVPVLEALWWIGEPLSAIGLVDVLDGYLTMWEAAHHLETLETLGVVEPSSTGQARENKNQRFEVQYRLRAASDGEA